MSLRSQFRKMFDPVESRREAFDQMSETLVAKPPSPPAPAESEGNAPFRCRVCGFLSEDASYCPICLAETMRPVPQPRVRR